MSRLDCELELFLDLDLDPEALAVEAVLVAQLVAGHGEVAVDRRPCKCGPRRGGRPSGYWR